MNDVLALLPRRAPLRRTSYCAAPAHERQEMRMPRPVLAARTRVGAGGGTICGLT